MAAMTICVKPVTIRCGYTLLVDTRGRGTSGPLASWRQMILLSQEARNEPGDRMQSVYFCPLKDNNGHYTLLEIEEQERVIRHYDSNSEVIDDEEGETRVESLVKVQFYYNKVD